MSCGVDNRVRIGPMTEGSTKRLSFPLLKDGATWTGVDSVTLTLRPPSGEANDLIRVATLTLPDTGVWYYDTVLGEIDEVGDWFIFVEAVDGAIEDIYPYEIVLEVVGGP